MRHMRRDAAVKLGSKRDMIGGEVVREDGR
jgi:hypothetical protein